MSSLIYGRRHNFLWHMVFCLSRVTKIITVQASIKFSPDSLSVTVIEKCLLNCTMPWIFTPGQDEMKWAATQLTDQMESPCWGWLTPPLRYSYCHYLHLLSFPFLSTPPTLTAAATTTAASTFWIAIFVTVPIDVEKAIIWASRSGNRVLVEVGRRLALFRENSPSQGCRGQWVPAWESWRSLLAIFSTFTLGPVVFGS